MIAIRALIREFLVMIAAALLLAVLGPFGMSALPFADRLGKWLLFAIGGYCCFRPVIAGGRALASASALPEWLAIGVACLLAALPTTVLVAWTFVGLGVRRMMLGDLAAIYPRVLLVGIVVTWIQFLIQTRRAVAAAPASQRAVSAVPVVETAPPPPFPSFIDRLPPSLGVELLCLENEDHYVRAHTAQGSALILMRMRDAVAELDGIEGARVHRSWWVARAAVAGVARRDRAVMLKLSNALIVPVARAEAPTLRAAGWW